VNSLKTCHNMILRHLNFGLKTNLKINISKTSSKQASTVRFILCAEQITKIHIQMAKRLQNRDRGKNTGMKNNLQVEDEVMESFVLHAVMKSH